MMNSTMLLIERINKNMSEEDLIEEKTNDYIDYIATHKKNVEKAWDYVKKIDNPYIRDNLDIIEDNIKQHDESKYQYDEFEWYRKKYFPINDEEANEVMDKINEVFELHYSRNPHHWEYWLDDDKELDYSRHSDEEVDNDVMIAYIEMLCDWASFGLKQNKPREVRSWYINEKPKMKLFPAEQEILEDILEEYIKNFPEKEEKDE